MGQSQRKFSDASIDEDKKLKKKLQPKRSKIVKEIVETERSYVEALLQLNEQWEKPLRKALHSGQPIITEDEIRTIFSISEGLLCLHQKLLASLEDCLSNWNSKQRIGDIFIRNAGALKLYTEYVNNYNNALLVLNRVHSEPAFMQFAKKMSSGKITIVLSSLLIQPIQRIPRYQLFMQELVNNTWETHVDKPALQNALHKIVESAVYINEQKRQAETIERLMFIQEAINDKYQLYNNDRVIVKEGQVILRKGKKDISVDFCMMNDALLVWQEGHDHLYADISAVQLIEDSVSDITLKHAGKTLVLQFLYPATKDQWVADFKKTVDKKKIKDDKIQRTVFLMSSPSAPLLNKGQNDSSECACIIL